ncbi:MAG: alpha/beta fold hydrolase [Mycoplasmatales bacterium]
MSFFISIIFYIVILSVFLISGLVCFFSVRKYQIKNQNQRSIDFGEYVVLNNCSHYLHHRGTNPNNPLMLVVHGGPGAPLIPYSHVYQFPLETEVTIVNWDQRSAGKTFWKNYWNKDVKLATNELLQTDLKSIIEYLKQTYNQEKIILFGHSWGSAMSAQYALENPEDIQLFISCGQLVNMVESEVAITRHVRTKIVAANNQIDLQRLMRIQPYLGSNFSNKTKKNILKLQALEAKYHNGKNSFYKQIYYVLESPFYTLLDTSYYLFALGKKVDPLLNDLIKHDLWSLEKTYSMPVHMIIASDDWITPTEISQQYFNSINAPEKQLYIMEACAHMMMIEQPLQFSKQVLQIVRDFKQKQNDSN